ncbi:MAG: hypothetical protein JJU23_09880 [Cyclobacteriaceae bacterium]|nr:hypothetical protein [Cyclobacteriaceae bacterium]
MGHLNSYELDITKEIFSIALANAVDAFSKMANEKVMIEDFELMLGTYNDLDVTKVESNKNFMQVLSTDIKGGLSGKTYLIFEKNDLSNLFNIFNPDASKSIDEEALSEIQQAILLELDNILVAAMVTQISNILELFCYGDVPSYSLKKPVDFEALLHENIKDFEVVIQLKANFRSYETNIKPRLYCFFTSDFICFNQAIDR